MISYQWDSQELAKKVFEKLEGLGFDAWMDLEDMSGNINEAMAEGRLKVEWISVCNLSVASKVKIKTWWMLENLRIIWTYDIFMTNQNVDNFSSY